MVRRTCHQGSACGPVSAVACGQPPGLKSGDRRVAHPSGLVADDAGCGQVRGCRGRARAGAHDGFWTEGWVRDSSQDPKRSWTRDPRRGPGPSRKDTRVSEGTALDQSSKEVGTIRGFTFPCPAVIRSGTPAQQRRGGARWLKFFFFTRARCGELGEGGRRRLLKNLGLMLWRPVSLGRLCIGCRCRGGSFRIRFKNMVPASRVFLTLGIFQGALAEGLAWG